MEIAQFIENITPTYILEILPLQFIIPITIQIIFLIVIMATYSKYVEQKGLNIIQKIGCLLLVIPVIFCSFYFGVALTLLTKYLDVIYIPLILFIAGLSICIYLLKKNGILTLLKVYLIVAIMLLPNVFLSKILLEQYIESVAYEKFGKKIDAHIQMNIISSHTDLSDNHASINHEKLGFMIWSFKERDFIEYKMRTGW